METNVENNKMQHGNSDIEKRNKAKNMRRKTKRNEKINR